MTFTGEVTLGNLAIVVTLIGIAIRVGQRLGSLQVTMTTHAEALGKHAIRLDRHEEKIIDLISVVQRLIGQSELWAERDRRRRPRE